MNHKAILDKLADFFVNFAVASFAVSAFQGVWYGIVPGLFSLIFAVLLASKLGGKSYARYLDWLDLSYYSHWLFRAIPHPQAELTTWAARAALSFLQAVGTPAVFF